LGKALKSASDAPDDSAMEHWNVQATSDERPLSLAVPWAAMIASPGICEQIAALGSAIRYTSSLDPKLLELTMLTVAAHWRSDFDSWAHARLAEVAGIDARTIEAVGRGHLPPEATEPQRLGHTITLQLVRNGSAEPRHLRAACRVLGDQGVTDLVAAVGYGTLNSMLLNAFAVEAPCDSVDRGPARQATLPATSR